MKSNTIDSRVTRGPRNQMITAVRLLKERVEKELHLARIATDTLHTNEPIIEPPRLRTARKELEVAQERLDRM